MATYNRGRHIIPSVRSVLAQTFDDFELLVVGDHCTDDTEEALRPFLCERVRWTNLAQRGGSQSFPNNEGIAQSRGRYIAYIGHDDVWAPNHLSAMSDCIEATGADYVVSGILMHSPPGVDLPRVTGMGEGATAPHEHFFPPSSITHRRSLTERIGLWRAPFDIRAPVDVDLQLRAVQAGMSFASTDKVTVHKFTATQRYLSYLSPDSFEQEGILDLLLGGQAGPLVQRAIVRAREQGLYMALKIPDLKTLKPGARYRSNASVKGAKLAMETSPLREIAVLPARVGPSAYDWDKNPSNGFLWNAKHLRPKFRIPFSCPSGGYASVVVAHRQESGLRRIRMTGPVSHVQVSEPRLAGDHWEAALSFHVALNREFGAVIGFDLSPDQRGLGLGTFVVRRAPKREPEASIQSLRGRVRRLEGRVRALQSSISWKITAPLRSIGALLRKGKRRRSPHR